MRYVMSGIVFSAVLAAATSGSAGAAKGFPLQDLEYLLEKDESVASGKTACITRESRQRIEKACLIRDRGGNPTSSVYSLLDYVSRTEHTMTTNLSDPPEFVRTIFDHVSVTPTSYGLLIRTASDYTGDGRIDRVSVERLDRRTCVSRHEVDYYNDGKIDERYKRQNEKALGGHCARYLLLKHRFRL